MSAKRTLQFGEEGIVVGMSGEDSRFCQGQTFQAQATIHLMEEIEGPVRWQDESFVQRLVTKRSAQPEVDLARCPDRLQPIGQYQVTAARPHRQLFDLKTSWCPHALLLVRQKPNPMMAQRSSSDDCPESMNAAFATPRHTPCPSPSRSA